MLFLCYYSYANSDTLLHGYCYTTRTSITMLSRLYWSYHATSNAILLPMCCYFYDNLLLQLCCYWYADFAMLLLLCWFYCTHMRLRSCHTHTYWFVSTGILLLSWCCFYCYVATDMLLLLCYFTVTALFLLLYCYTDTDIFLCGCYYTTYIAIATLSPTFYSCIALVYR